MPVSHFLLTRFNIRIFRHDKHGKAVMSPDRTRDRFELFEKYCFPSVLNQSTRDFKWLCLFDKDTPVEYRERIDGYRHQFPGFIPYFLDSNEALDYVNYFRLKVAGFSEPGSIVVTTYLDNDDMLHRNYMQTVEDYARRATKRSVISFSEGLQYYTEYGFSARVSFRNNHFLTMVEKPAEGKLPLTVIGIGHIYLDKYKNLNVVEDVQHKGMWIEVVHNHNVANDVLFRAKAKYYHIEDSEVDYGCKLEDKGNSSFVRHYYPRFVRHAFHRLALKIKGDSLPPYIKTKS